MRTHGHTFATTPMALLLGLLLGACDDDLPKISLVSEMDIFGHRIEVEGDPERATPQPGESASIQWQVLFPEQDSGDEQLSILAVECTFPERYVGEPFCQELLTASEDDETTSLSSLDGIFAGGSSLSCADGQGEIVVGTVRTHCLQGQSTLSFTVPEDFSASARLFTGIVCRNSTAQLDSSGFGCAGNDAEEVEYEHFFSQVSVQQEPSDANRNPNLDALELYLDGVRWLAWDGDALPTATDCAATNGDATEENQIVLAHIETDQEHTLEFLYADEDRERYDDRLERIRISHRATAGDFERASSYISENSDPDENMQLSTDVTWELPGEEESPQIIRFFIGIRDGRGGFTSTERFACRPNMGQLDET